MRIILLDSWLPSRAARLRRLSSRSLRRLQDVRNKCRKLAQHVKRLEARCGAAVPDAPQWQQAGSTRVAPNVDTVANVSVTVAQPHAMRSCSQEQPADQTAAAAAVIPAQPASSQDAGGCSGEQAAVAQPVQQSVGAGRLASAAPAGPPEVSLDATAQQASSAAQAEAEQASAQLSGASHTSSGGCGACALLTSTLSPPLGASC